MFSQRAQEIFAHVNQGGINRQWDAVQILKSLGKDVESEQERDALEMLAGAISMSFNKKKQSFTPLFESADGRRSFSMDDISNDDIAIIKEAMLYFSLPFIRAQLAHILWLITEEYQCAQIAVDEYLKVFDNEFNPQNWTTCYDAIQIAYDISMKLGRKTEYFKKVFQTIKDSLLELDGTDPLFLSLRLIRLIHKEADSKTNEAMLTIIEKLANRNINVANSEYHLAEETFNVHELLLKRLNKSSEINTAKLNLANYYEKHAALLSEAGQDFRAIILLKKACVLCSCVDKEKTLKLRARLEELQKLASDNMVAIPFQFDISSMREAISVLYDGLSFQETIVQLGRTAATCQVNEVRKSVIEEQKEFVFQSLFSNSYLNNQGQTICELPPLSRTDPEKDQDLFFKHMVRYVSKRREIGETIALNLGLEYLRRFGDFAVDELDFLVNNNPIIPENREEILKEGLHLALSGRMYAALHILLPQTEQIFRNLVKMCGDSVTFLNDDGTESIKTLSLLFKSEKLKEAYSEDIIFTFQSIMDVPAGENLRNMIAHGVLDPQSGNGGSALCFVCLLIKLLCLYSPAVQPIIRRLINREKAVDGDEV